MLGRVEGIGGRLVHFSPPLVEKFVVYLGNPLSPNGKITFKPEKFAKEMTFFGENFYFES